MIENFEKTPNNDQNRQINALSDRIVHAFPCCFFHKHEMVY